MDTFWQIFLIVALVLLLLLVFIYRRILCIVIVTLPRDVRGLYKFGITNVFVFYQKYANMTAAKYFDSKMDKRRNKPCFLFEEEIWTYEKVQKESYKIANYFQSQGYKKGDTIALIMENRPEYVCIWLGLSRIGVITSLINYNVRLESLEHCVKVANSKAIIFGTELIESIQEVIDIGGFKNINLFSIDDRKPVVTKLTTGHVDLTKILEYVKSTPTVCNDVINSSDTILNIYTSGTTGLPKAVIMSHSRIFAYSPAYILVDFNDKDVLITPIPLYHVQGGIVGVTTALFFGVPQVIVRKFSASKFWEQCIKYNVTVAQYLGEIIRYLCNQPEKPEDKLHKVRMFVGNGVNQSIWSKFVERFNVCIKEMYGSTEGNCSIMNLEGHVGACGYLPIWIIPLLPMIIAKVDEITGDIIRNPKTGLVQPEAIGVPGELLGQIQKNNPMREFNGYTDKDATEKKIIRDVKKKGDAFFRTGDLIELDEYGYAYFRDRAGDTFRWKGENVSTAEVEIVVTKGAGMKGTVVYGVLIPGTEGKCGMATVCDPNGTLDLKSLAAEVTRSLPAYAMPLFLRVTKKELNMTGTFKLQKVDFQKEGFDIEKIKEDLVYFFKEGNYILLDKALYHDIISGKIRV